MQNLRLWSPTELVSVLEALGILPPRPEHCGKRMIVAPKKQPSGTTYTLPGGLPFTPSRDRANYYCSRCHHEAAVGLEADIWTQEYTLWQNAHLLLKWPSSPELNSHKLAQEVFVDANKLLTGWLAKARAVIERVQTHASETVQLGGPGVEVEMDELCFRCKWSRPDGSWGKEWVRYIAASERHGDKVVLMKLDTRWSTGAGQGGGGQLSREELYAFIFRPHAPGSPPLLRPGTIVHTDGAFAYRDLSWYNPLNAPFTLSPEEVAELLALRPRAWRLENCREHLLRIPHQVDCERPSVRVQVPSVAA